MCVPSLKIAAIFCIAAIFIIGNGNAKAIFPLRDIEKHIKPNEIDFNKLAVKLIRAISKLHHLRDQYHGRINEDTVRMADDYTIDIHDSKCKELKSEGFRIPVGVDLEDAGKMLLGMAKRFRAEPTVINNLEALTKKLPHMSISRTGSYITMENMFRRPITQLS